MRRRTVVSGATLVVLLLVLCGMAWYGFRAATQPLPGSAARAGEECAEEERQVKRFVDRGDVQVSVFNAGSTSGLAGRTLDQLEDRGFVGGNAGNAPPRAGIRRAVVWTTDEDVTAARLVARNLGRGVRVRVVERDLGPGVDVLVGDELGGLAPNGPRRLELPEPVEQCIQVD
ncbi:LytR C-terminal domain-containing protein [Nocardioides aequoreus]|uniref:LytR C-terminal domain-containing protein n=1 Tax=Nocardioides aequoreus TaxID=397278 RepID=UPI00068EA1E0|nr:LytR C-terminal domain-containing protein [Nocardioides aequoreus]